MHKLALSNTTTSWYKVQIHQTARATLINLVPFHTEGITWIIAQSTGADAAPGRYNPKDLYGSHTLNTASEHQMKSEKVITDTLGDRNTDKSTV